jgi:hypothetical protein
MRLTHPPAEPSSRGPFAAPVPPLGCSRRRLARAAVIATAALAAGLSPTVPVAAQPDQRPPALRDLPGAPPPLPPAGETPPGTPAPPAKPPAEPHRPRTPAEEAKVTQRLDYLEKDAYGKKLTAPFWVSRAMGVISMARLPRPSVTTRLLEVCETDKQDVVRLLAWQAVLARAADLDAKLHKRWVAAALSLAEKDGFRGEMRVALLDALATAPPSVRGRRVWEKIYAEANAWEPQDIAALNALGRALTVWRSKTLVDKLVTDLADPNNGPRAEFVLHAAGCDVKTAHDSLDPKVFDSLNPDRRHPSSGDLWKLVQTDARAWLDKNKAQWKEPNAIEGEPWRALKPLYVGAPVPLEEVDPKDPLWTADLEIGRADLGQIEAVFVVDATGSMQEVLDWLRRDVARVMLAFGLLAKESPKLGLVFYRDKDVPPVVISVPMTYKLADLGPKLAEIKAQGGGDIPEAVLDGLTAAVDGMKWSKAKGVADRTPAPDRARPAGATPVTTAAPPARAVNPNAVSQSVGKLVILVGDAPPKPGTLPECEAVAKRAAAAGIKVYACKVTTADGRNDLSDFDAIAKAGSGTTVDATFAPLVNFKVVDTATGKLIPLQTIARPEAQLVVATGSAEQPPGERILTHVLSDLISPQYKDRVEPLSRTLVSYVQPKSEPEKRLAFPGNTPPLNRTTYDSQKK